MRRRTGLPHRILLFQAHCFLRQPVPAWMLDPVLGGLTLVTCRVSDLDPDVVRAAGVVIVTRETDPGEVGLLQRAFHGTDDRSGWQQALGALEIDEAVLLPVCEEARGALRRFRIAPRFTAHVRHRHKYLDEPVREDLAFRFVWRDGSAGPVARSLQDLVLVLAETTPARWLDHLRRGDLSRWIDDVLRDEVLAAHLRDIERQCDDLDDTQLRDRIISAVRERYVIGTCQAIGTYQR